MERFVEARLSRGLIVGFALVLFLLGVASVVAVEGTQAIKDGAKQVIQEQVVMTRLLHDAQAGQNLLAAVLHKITRTPDETDEDDLLHDLESADAALDRVAESAASTPEAARWAKLHDAERSFSSSVRAAINGQEDAPEATLLFDEHEAVVRLERDLLNASERRITEAERNLADESRQLATRSVILLGACFALALLCAGLTVTFARRSVRSIEWHANELSRVSWHMLQSQEKTARRFSHELHDELGQALAAVRANLTSTGAQDWDGRREDCMHLVDGAIANVRELSQLLRPVILDDFGLDASLRWLGERFADRTGIQVHYDSNFKGRLPDETETHLFRIAQEAFTNVARHSGASEVHVDLNYQNDMVRLTVEDNGRGLNETNGARPPSLGMTGMRARARQAGGELLTTRPPGGGLRIQIEVPKYLPQEVHAV